ncbi:hypothetical protein [uncultured Flavobacterium sp.]|uniref:hypothetical protein n=1 Tax=uncultured Flavobacterium sp. TaxID=165435 RepID=UPI0030ECEBB5|tara:strand:- start:1950 stop:2246 length:297 start_codon:yes stop_codon:yes gene_type:complete
MKSKITFLKLASLLLTDNKFSGFDIPKPWTDLVRTVAFLSQEIVAAYPFFDSLRTIAINMDSLPVKLEKLTIVARPSIYITTNRGEFHYLKSPHFLTI